MGQHRQSSAALCPNAPAAALLPPAIPLNTTVKSEIAAAKRLHTYAQLQIMPHTAAPHEATLAAHGSTQPKRTCNGSAPTCNRTKQNGKVLKLKCKMAPHPLTATKHHSNSGCSYGSIGNPRSARRLAPQKLRSAKAPAFVDPIIAGYSLQNRFCRGDSLYRTKPLPNKAPIKRHLYLFT